MPELELHAEQHLGRNADTPVAPWHRDFDGYLPVLEAATQVNSRAGQSDPDTAFLRLARTFITDTSDEEELRETGRAMFTRLLVELPLDTALEDAVRNKNSAARARWVWTVRVHRGASIGRAGEIAAQQVPPLCTASDHQKWAEEFAWAQGLRVPKKYRETAASGLRAVTDAVRNAIENPLMTQAQLGPQEALKALVPDELMTTRLQRRIAQLTDLQQRALPRMVDALENDQPMLLGGPTGSGKTLLAQIAAMAVSRRRHRRAIIAVPLKALVRDIYEDLRSWAREAGLDEELVVLPGSRDYPEFDDDLARGRYDIAVLIYEKLNAYMAMGFSPLDEAGLLVIDELQQLNDPERGTKIESLITTVRNRHGHVPIMGLSSALDASSWSNLATWLRVRADNQILSTSRPVPLDVAVTDGRQTLTLAGISPDDTDEPGEARPRVPDGTAPSHLRERAVSMRTQNEGRKLDVPEDLGRLPVAAALDIIQMGAEFSLASDNNQILMFTRNRATAKSLARDLRTVLSIEAAQRPAFLGSVVTTGGARTDNPWINGRFVKPPTDDEGQRQADERHTEVLRSGLGSFRDELLEAVRTGVGYHTAEVPRMIQQELEREYLEGNIRVLISTKTLAIGVNLPVDIVIVGHVTTYGRALEDGGKLQGPGLQLLEVGELRNMIGRAGRLGLSDRGLALVTTEHWPTLDGLDHHERELVKDSRKIWNHFIKPQDFSTSLRSRLYQSPQQAAWLVLQALVSDDFDRTRPFSDAELRGYIARMMGSTYAAVSGTDAPPVDRVRDELVDRRLLSSVEPDSFQVSGLGIGLAKSGIPVTESTTIASVLEAIEDRAGTLEIIYRLCRGEHLSRQVTYTQVRYPSHDRHALADVAKRVAQLARVYTEPTPTRRRFQDDRVRAIYKTAPRHERLLSQRAVRGSDEVTRLLEKPELMTLDEVNALMRSVVAYEWTLGIAYSDIEKRVVDVCTLVTQQRRAGRPNKERRYTPTISVSSVENLTEQLSYILAGARDLTPLGGEQPERARVQRLASALELGLPAWLAPISGLKMLSLDRERLTRIAHREPAFELTREVLDWPELDLLPEEIVRARELLAKREELLKGDFTHLPSEVLEASPLPAGYSGEHYTFRRYIEDGLKQPQFHLDTVKALLELYLPPDSVVIGNKRDVDIHTANYGGVRLRIIDREITQATLREEPSRTLTGIPVVLVARRGLNSGALAILDVAESDFPAVLPERTFISMLFHLRDSPERERDLLTALTSVSGYVKLDQVKNATQRAAMPAPPPFKISL
ncbi:MAG: DEAD/DEAH box helicase [Nocardioides sp.]|nr:DEAD/DEAH box helicase [Nocardioides sp.]